MLHMPSRGTHSHSAQLKGRASEWARAAARGIQLLVLFVPLAVTAPFAFLAGAWDAAGVWRSRWGDLLLHTLMLAGPAFMKWGQWAAARPDIVPQDLALKLETLHMDAPTHSQVRTPSTRHRLFQPIYQP